MHRQVTRTAVLTVLAVLISILGFVSPAQAAETVPTLKWPAIGIGANAVPFFTGQDGSVTLPCTNTNGGSNTTTYSATGALVRELDRATMIDGVNTCLTSPVVGKNGDIYGMPWKMTGGGYGPNLLAYSGNTLKWKYPATCTSSPNQLAVGANGNIYAATSGHLIGLTPDVATGQTQPTKVLDVTIPNDCSIQLQAYKDGLVLHGQNSGNARYYSYAGKFLGQATIGDIWAEKVNADGKLFVGSYVSGSFTSAKVSMYDPRTGQVTWNTIASTSGANVNSVQVFPVTGGGVVALIDEQKMISGIPASPTQYVKMLKVLNSSGNVTKSMELPNTYSQSGITGLYNGNTWPVAAGQGKLAVVRDLYFNTGISSPRTIAGIYIGVYDIPSDSWTYQQVMKGDLTKAGGPSGYYLNSTQFGVTNGILHLNVRCSGNCDNYDTKMFALDIGGLSLDYPRGDVLAASTPTQPTPVSYVALGDSYSSGQGAGNYDQYTTIPTNYCYKSNNAYGNALNRDPNSKLRLIEFAACGGAVTANITSTSTYPDVPYAQKYAVVTATQVVTLTIGGNDIGFADVILTCANPTADCNAAFNTANGKINATLNTNLKNAYTSILDRTASGKLKVLSYPRLFVPGSAGCQPAYPVNTADRVTKANTLLANLNAAIKTAVKNVNDTPAYANRIQFIDATLPSSPFIGHEVCTGSEYINGVMADQRESFHPNRTGNQEGYASLVKANS